MHIIGVSERREETGTDGIFEEIIVENLKLMMDTKPQKPGRLENSHGIKSQNTTHRQIIVKLRKPNIKRKY